MTDNSENKTEIGIRIDYDNVDVKDIMSQIQDRISNQSESPAEEEKKKEESARTLSIPELPDPQPSPVPISAILPSYKASAPINCTS